MNTATLGEIEQFEADAGLTWDEFTAGKSSVRTTMALICLQERRQNPKYTLDDARKLKVSEISFESEDEASVPPTPGKRSPKGAS
jgi:hypothetical protein